jgi:hypothetical protein
MSKHLVPKKPVLPPEWQKFFNPPLVGNEKYEDYMIVFDAIAMALQPKDIIQWFNVKEIADNTLELQRERGIKSDIIMLNQKKVCSSASLELMRSNWESQKALEKNPSAFKKKDPQPKAADEQPRSWLAEAYILGHRDIDIIDERIASYAYRRDAALRRNERYTQSLDRNLTPIIDGEFTDLEA